MPTRPAGTDRKTADPKVSEGAQRWRLTMEHFYVTDPQADPEAQDDAPRPATDRAPELADRAITVFQGRINGEFQHDEITQDVLTSASFGLVHRKAVTE